MDVLEKISKSEQNRIQYENELIFDFGIRGGLNRAMEGEIKGIKERKICRDYPIEKTAEALGFYWKKSKSCKADNSGMLHLTK